LNLYKSRGKKATVKRLLKALPALALLLVSATPANATTINLSSGQTYDGHGQTLYADDCSSCSVFYVRGDGVTIRNVTIVGTNPTGADGVNHLDSSGRSMQWQHGIRVAGASNVKIEHVTARNLWGDGVAVESSTLDGSCSATPARNIAISDLTARNNGRNGVSFIEVEGGSLTRSSINGTGYGWLVDMEPDFACYPVHDITVKRNTFGYSQQANVNLTGPYGCLGVDPKTNPSCLPNDPFSNIRVTDNTFTALNATGQPVIQLAPIPGYYGHNATVRDNCIPAGTSVSIYRFDGVNVANNGPCSSPRRG
jgi:hypothetical protein